eukprot:3312003-Alexandrium_andersonii.AAC.1
MMYPSDDMLRSMKRTTESLNNALTLIWTSGSTERVKSDPDFLMDVAAAADGGPASWTFSTAAAQYLYKFAAGAVDEEFYALACLIVESFDPKCDDPNSAYHEVLNQNPQSLGPIGVAFPNSSSIENFMCFRVICIGQL